MSMCPLDNNIIAFGVPVASEGRSSNLIDLVNFAQSARIQTLRTQHLLPMIELDYSPDSEQAPPPTTIAITATTATVPAGDSFPSTPCTHTTHARHACASASAFA